jgi:hypothetical protein
MSSMGKAVSDAVLLSDILPYLVLCRKKCAAWMLSAIVAVCSRVSNMKENPIILGDCAMTCWKKEYGDVLKMRVKGAIRQKNFHQNTI